MTFEQNYEKYVSTKKLTLVSSIGVTATMGCGFKFN